MSTQEQPGRAAGRADSDTFTGSDVHADVAARGRRARRTPRGGGDRSSRADTGAAAPTRSRRCATPWYRRLTPRRRDAATCCVGRRLPPALGLDPHRADRAQASPRGPARRHRLRAHYRPRYPVYPGAALRPLPRGSRRPRLRHPRRPHRRLDGGPRGATHAIARASGSRAVKSRRRPRNWQQARRRRPCSAWPRRDTASARAAPGDALLVSRPRQGALLHGRVSLWRVARRTIVPLRGTRQRRGPCHPSTKRWPGRGSPHLA